MAAIRNALPGTAPVAKFKDRKTAVQRIRSGSQKWPIQVERSRLRPLGSGVRGTAYLTDRRNAAPSSMLVHRSLSATAAVSFPKCRGSSRLALPSASSVSRRLQRHRRRSGKMPSQEHEPDLPSPTRCSSIVAVTKRPSSDQDRGPPNRVGSTEAAARPRLNRGRAPNRTADS
jgi:hypothetical protein